MADTQSDKPAVPYWKCKECGYLMQEAQPPEQCPSCKKKCEFVDVSCYTPECGLAGPDPKLMGK